MEYVTLNTGAKMPLEGFGVFQIPDAAECEQVVYDAIKTGYRLLDTAASYGNEEALGKGVKRAIADGLVTREELFITTKVWITDMKTEDSAYEAVKTSLRKLDMPYVDLVLLHQAMGDYFAAYRGITRAYKEGLTKAIGVSNFYPKTYEALVKDASIIPSVNQIETHVFYQQRPMVELMARHGTAVESWGPLAEGLNGIFTHPVLKAIADKHGKSVGQVVLHWMIQRGIVVIPKSTHLERMKQNIDVFDFELIPDDMQRIAQMNQTDKGTVNFNDPAFIKQLIETYG